MRDLSRRAVMNRLRRDPAVEVLVIGAGINGAAVFRELALNGVRVLLVDRGDIAEGASSALSRMVHGGLRYLETAEFALVREGATERNRLLRNAPHIVRPLRFLIPHDPSMRPVWMIRIGLFLYDHLARREIRIAIETFLDRFANIRIPAGAHYEYHAGPTFNVDSLPLEWDRK